MQYHRMNKRGIFLPIYVLVYIVILIALLSVVKSAAENKNDMVGLRSINIIKANQESEKIEFYLDMSGKYAYQDSLKKLAENGGYSEDNKCGKTSPTLLDKDQYIILNTCSVPDEIKEFSEQLKIEVSQYIELYESNYKNSKRKNTLTEDGESTNYKEKYTQKVKDLNPIEVKDIKDHLVISLTQLTLPIEGSKESFLITNPKIVLNKPDLSIYKEINSLISKVCIKKEYKKCENAFKLKFPKAKVSNEENLVKLNIPAEAQETIRIAFYTDKPIPAYIT